MIIGTGVDIVTINRFDTWLSFSPERLSRIFHPDELKEYFKKERSKAVFLASRFAVKEAFFKALTQSIDLFKTEELPPFLTLAPLTHVTKTELGAPLLSSELLLWKKLVSQGVIAHLSLSHEKTDAIAFVILEK